MWKCYYVHLFSGLLVRLWTISVTPGMLCDDISYSRDVLWVDQLLSPFGILCEISLNLGMMCLDLSYLGMLCEISVTMGMLCECQSLGQCCEPKPVIMDARWISVSLKAMWGYQKVNSYMQIFITLGLLDKEIHFVCDVWKNITVLPIIPCVRISVSPVLLGIIFISPVVLWKDINITLGIL
jgi:hypothetical protein